MQTWLVFIATFFLWTSFHLFYHFTDVKFVMIIHFELHPFTLPKLPWIVTIHFIYLFKSMSVFFFSAKTNLPHFTGRLPKVCFISSLSCSLHPFCPNTVACWSDCFTFELLNIFVNIYIIQCRLFERFTSISPVYSPYPDILPEPVNLTYCVYNVSFTFKNISAFQSLNVADLLKTHITGVISHGHGDMRSFIDLNQFPHDPNLTMNIILKVLSKIAQENVGYNI